MSPAEQLLAATQAIVVDRHIVPPREEQCAPIPAAFADGPVASWIKEMVAGEEVWRHQAEGLEHIGEGSDVLLATATASGKSLVLWAPIIKGLLENSEDRYLMFCPQISLTSDQLHRLGDAVEKAGLPRNLIAEINGDVPVSERAEILERSRVLIVTPDVVHRSFLSSLTSPQIRTLLSNLAIVTIDEAHQFNSVFGSNCCLFFRRLEAACQRMRQEDGLPPRRIQYIGASATIADPAGHMRALTGRAFIVVDESHNGAPHHGLTLLHLEGPDHGAPSEALMVEYLSSLASEIAPDTAIAFVDGRQPAERISVKVNAVEVEPYRAGFEKADRLEIEQALRRGDLRALVATSAMESGVDVRQFKYGFTLGVPASRNSLKQRAGRTGRDSEAVFAIVAPAQAFAQLGMTLREFYEASPDPAPLYPENSIIQFRQACCLLHECGGGDVATLPEGIDWPAGFARAFQLAMPGTPRPPEIEQVVNYTHDLPHAAYLLRSVESLQLKLKEVGTGDDLGSIDYDKALREAYPGAILYQRKRRFKVLAWSTSYGRSITLKSASFGAPTHPIIRSQIGVSHQGSDVQDGHLQVSDRGSLAEIRLQVNESIEGYRQAGKEHYYRDLQKQNPQMCRRQREFSTTGVVLINTDPWFTGVDGAALQKRDEVATALVTLLVREHGVSPHDIGYAVNSISMHGAVGGPKPIANGIALYDKMAGGVRLTQPLFNHFSLFLDRLRRGADMAGTEALLGRDSVERLESWFASLKREDKRIDVIPVLGVGEQLIYAPYSMVAVQHEGELKERRLLGHEMMSIAGKEKLVYKYECSPGVTARVPHDSIRPVGNAWRHLIWNPRENTTREAA